MKTKIQQLLISPVLFSVSGAFLVWSLLDAERMKFYFSYASYYMMAALFIAGGWTWAQFFQARSLGFKEGWQIHREGIFFSLILTGLIFLSVHPYFRILSDETNLLAVSKSMIYERRIDNITMGKWYYFNFYPFNYEWPTRPFLFPFLTHLFHALLGFRPGNPFILNFVLLTFLFSVVFYLFKKNFRSPWAYAAVLAAAAQPVLTQCATSAGYDLLAACLILITLITLAWYLEASTPEHFRLLWMTLLFLAHVRHESFLFGVVILAALGFMGKIQTKVWQGSYVFSLSPVFLAPLVWQKRLQFASADPFETFNKVPAFSWEHLKHHSRDFLKLFCDFNFDLPYATAINILGAAGVIFLACQWIARSSKHRPSWFPWFGISSLCFVTVVLVVHAYHLGSVTHSFNSRIFLPFLILFSLAAVAFLQNIPVFQRKPGLAVFLMTGFFLIYHPLSIENRFANAQVLPREYRVALDFLKQYPDRNFLVIADRPGMYTARDYGAVNFNHAHENKKQLLHELERHLFKNIFVIQEILYDTQSPTRETRLDPDFRQEPVLEIQNTADSFIRISRVVLPAKASK